MRELDLQSTTIYLAVIVIAVSVGYFPVISLLGIVTTLLIVTVKNFRGNDPIYLVDFSICRPHKKYKVSHDACRILSEQCGLFSQEDIDFQRRVLSKSGISDKAYYAPGIVLFDPPDLSMDAARKEFEYVLSDCMDDLLERTHINVQDIDIVICNCSLFSPTPSLCSIIVNKYKIRETVDTYNLSGMGCSAGLISVHLAKQLLLARPNSRCLIVSTENITQNWYRGKDRSMMVSNTLFRMGAAAILMSNRRQDSWTSRYKLEHTVRVTTAADDESIQAVVQREDAEGVVGVSLSKDIVRIIGTAMRKNIERLAPLILPWSEKLKYAASVAYTYIDKSTMVYTPDIAGSVDHFCIHAGGRAVVDGVAKQLHLSSSQIEPSRQVLNRYGNTSSSSIWYELAYIESKGRMKAGDLTWQLAFGSGCKCNSAVWKALKSIATGDRQFERSDGDGRM